MSCTINQAKERILNKWDWENSDTSYPVILWGAPGVGKTHLVISLVCERMIKDLESQYLEQVKNLYNESDEYKTITKEFEKKLKILNFDYVTYELLDLISPHCLVLRLAERPIEQLQGVIVPSLSENYARFVMPENLLMGNG